MSSLLKALNFGRGKHKKLPEEWGESIKQPVNEGMSFYVKYLGSTLVEEPSSETATADAIKAIIAMAKASGKKLSHVSLTVKPSGISTRDVVTGERHLDVSIYRISYCSADATYDRVVAFIATNKNETLECHAFLTSKKKVAQAAALTISQAFTIAFEKWKTTKSGQKDKEPVKGLTNGDATRDLMESQKPSKGSPDLTPTPASEPALIDLSVDDSLCQKQLKQRPEHTLEFDFDLDDSFSKLAKSRTGSERTDRSEMMMLPTNLKLNSFQELNSYLSSEANARDDRFFSDDSPDDLLSL
jgi:low density lipoprotein receptor adapter protein 1